MAPSSSLPLDDTIEVLRQHLSDSHSDLLNAIVKDLMSAQREIAQDKAADAADKGKKPKPSYAVLIRGDSNLKKLVEGGAWIVSVPDAVSRGEGETDVFTKATLLERIYKAVKLSNETPPKGRAKRRASHAIKTFFHAMENLKPKAIKMAHDPVAQFGIKTKYPVPVLVVEKEDIP